MMRAKVIKQSDSNATHANIERVGAQECNLKLGKSSLS
jgi:hypothetical protein